MLSKSIQFGVIIVILGLFMLVADRLDSSEAMMHLEILYFAGPDTMEWVDRGVILILSAIYLDHLPLGSPIKQWLMVISHGVQDLEISRKFNSETLGWEPGFLKQAPGQRVLALVEFSTG